MSRILPLLLTLLSLPAIAEPRISGVGWSPDLRKTIPDVVAVDLALRRAGLKPGDASLVYGRTLWRANDSGIVQRHATIGWRLLSGPPVIDEVSSRQPRTRRICTMMPGHDPAPGGRTLQLYRQAEPRADQLDTARKEPRFILGTSAHNEVLITALRPGDQVQIVEAVPVAGGPTQEHLELQREGRRLSVTRLGNGSRICLEDGR